MSFDVKGLFLELRAEAWINGRFSDNAGYPSGLTTVEKKLWDGCKHLWTLEDGTWFYGPDEQAREKRKKFREDQTKKAQLSVQSRKNQQTKKISVENIDQPDVNHGSENILTVVQPIGNANGYVNGKELVIKKRGKGMGKEKKPKLLFRDSPVFEISSFRMAFLGTAYEHANLEHYHEAALSWSDGDENKKSDWVATVRGWMSRDLSEGKLKLKNSINGKRVSEPDGKTMVFDKP